MSERAGRVAGDGRPQRTCVGCRKIRPKATLVRLVRRADGTVVADARGPGRGVYVCVEALCVERAMKRLAAAFRKPSVAAPELMMVVRAAGRAATGRAPARGEPE